MLRREVDGDVMSQPARAQEPSMEEILASIRRIIADDDGNKPAAKPAVAAAAPAPPPQPPRPVTPPPAAPAPSPVMKQADVDAVMAGLDVPVGQDTGPKDDVLELTESMATATSATPSFQTIDGQSDVVFTEPTAAPEPPPRAVDDSRRASPPPAAPPSPALLSTTTTAAVDSAFNSLAQTVLIQNARTLEDLVREMLRPMLKSWLDDNLPGIVERIVRAEIERVSRGRS